MTTVATSKASKATVAASDPNAVNDALVGMMREARASIEGTALGILLAFAERMESGSLSVNGAKATIDAAIAAGAAVPEIKKGHAQHFVLMAKLSLLAGWDGRIASLYTLADRMVRVAAKADGVSKADIARSSAEKATERGTTFDAAKKAVDKKWAARKVPNRPSRPEGHADKPASFDALAAIESLTAWVHKAAYADLTVGIQSALDALAHEWEMRSEELAEGSDADIED